MAGATPDDDRAHCAPRACARSGDFTGSPRTRKADVRREQSSAEMPVYWLSEVPLHTTRHLDRREFIQLAGLATAGVAGADALMPCEYVTVTCIRSPIR